MVDKWQILYIWTPWFTLVKPLTLLFSDVLVSFCVFAFLQDIKRKIVIFKWKYIKSWKFGIAGKSIDRISNRSIENCPKSIDRIYAELEFQKP